jgi:hypothetical protein
MALIGRLTVMSAFAALLAACASSSHVLVGAARAPITPEQVKIYLQPPAQYEQIATLDASSGTFLINDQKKTDKAILRLKQEAAKLGANGILLEGVEKQQSGSIGLGLGGASFGNSSAAGGGVGTSGGLYVKAARGLAIYVPE